MFHNYGAFGELTWFAAERDRLIGGLRLDRASVKDYRQTLKSGHMGHAMANPTANDTRADTLPSGFVRYEHDLADSPTTLYAGLGHAEGGQLRPRPECRLGAGEKDRAGAMRHLAPGRFPRHQESAG